MLVLRRAAVTPQQCEEDAGGERHAKQAPGSRAAATKKARGLSRSFLRLSEGIGRAPVDLLLAACRPTVLRQRPAHPVDLHFSSPWGHGQKGHGAALLVWGVRWCPAAKNTSISSKTQFRCYPNGQKHPRTHAQTEKCTQSTVARLLRCYLPSYYSVPVLMGIQLGPMQ